MVAGNLHSIESMGLVDGPGIRTVFFLQGCPLRCKYCHNPDSQTCKGGSSITPEEVVRIAKRYKPYYKNSGGGVTFSGGEPLIQGEFLLETVKLLKEEDIHVTIDTCGFGDKRYYKEILKYVDLIMLDLKHYDNEGYKLITGRNINEFDNFIKYLDDYKGELIIRHVMVPTITDNDESIYKILKKLKPINYKIDKIEILPYHKMGVHKYETLNREYEMGDIPEMNKSVAATYEEKINGMLKGLKKIV